MAEAPAGPAARHHGDVFSDPYEWLRDKQDGDVIAYLEAENAYTEARTGHLTGLTEAVFEEIKARTQETDLSVPTYTVHADGTAYWYYVRTVEGSEYAIYCRTAAPDGPGAPPDVEGEIAGEAGPAGRQRRGRGRGVLLPGRLRRLRVGRLLAYATDTAGDERFRFEGQGPATGELLADEITDIAYGIAWAGEDDLFYTRADAAWRPYVVLRHRLGTPTSADAEVLTEPDERFWVGVGLQPRRGSGSCSGWEQADQRVPAAARRRPRGHARLVAPRRQGVEYDVEPAGDRLLIVHNDGAPDFELAEAPLERHQPRAVDPGAAPHGRVSGSPGWRRTPATPWSRCAATG